MKKAVTTLALLLGFILMAGGNQYAPIIFIPSLLLHLKWEITKFKNMDNIQTTDY